MSKKQDFVSDLKLGQFYEDEYIKLRRFKNVHHPKDIKFKDYDFKNNRNEKSYEVKADRKAPGTGNLFIEYLFKNEYSGINTSKADYWVHYIVDKNDIYNSKKYMKIKCEKLREIIKMNKFQTRKGGDKYMSDGFLLPISHVKKYIFDV